MTFLQKVYWVCSVQLGLDPRKLIGAVYRAPGYLMSWLEFRRQYSGSMRLLPCLHDRSEEAGAVKSEYFWQDLHVAREIFEAEPCRHVDIGSRIDGFVAHVASYREIEVFDIRPIENRIPNVTFHAKDLMNPSSVPSEYCDSVSCLHTLEHFGLGRYGDQIDVYGHVKGLQNIARILKTDGTLYLSVPIGRARVEFNANRVFDPVTLVDLVNEFGLLLRDFVWFETGRAARRAENISETLRQLAMRRYCLGLFTFRKH